MRFVRAVMADPGVKLLALLLAWGLWFVVRADMADSRAMVFAVIVRAEPGAGLEGELSRDRVRVVVRGPQREIDMLMNGTRPLVLALRRDELAPDQLSATRRVTAEDLSLPEPVATESVSIRAIEGSPLDLRVWRVESQPVPLRAPEFPGAEDLGVQVERRSWPQRVVIRGPTEALKALPYLDSRVDREELRRAVQRMGGEPRVPMTLPLVLPDLADTRLTVLEPRTPEVQVDLVRIGGAQVSLPIGILDTVGAAPRSARIVPNDRPWIAAGDPPRVVLDLRGAPKSVASVTPQTVRAFVLLGDLPEGATRGEVRIHLSDLPAGVALARDTLTAIVEITSPR